MARRRTIGENPLDALLAPVPAPPKRDAAAGKGIPPAPVAARSTATERAVKATFNLPAALVEEAKDAVVALSGPPLRLTLAALAREALRRELDRLRKDHHQGKAFPPRSAPLVGGRPLKT